MHSLRRHTVLSFYLAPNKTTTTFTPLPNYGGEGGDRLPVRQTLEQKVYIKKWLFIREGNWIFNTGGIPTNNGRYSCIFTCFSVCILSAHSHEVHQIDLSTFCISCNFFIRGRWLFVVVRSLLVLNLLLLLLLWVSVRLTSRDWLGKHIWRRINAKVQRPFFL